MIVKMRKMDLLLYHREREKFLDELRNLGVVHITTDAQAVDSAAAQELAAKAQLAQRAVSALSLVQAQRGAASSPVAAADVPGLLSGYEECEAKRERIEQEFAALHKDGAALAPWGEFDPRSVKRLADAGVGMAFYTMPAKKFEALDRSALGIQVITSRDSLVYFVAVYRGEQPEIPGAEETRLPEIGFKDISAKVTALEAQRAEVAAKIDTLASHTADIRKYCAELKNELQFERARASMSAEADGKLLRLTGWVPQKNEAKLAAFLQNYPAYVTFRDPTGDDSVPVKLKNGPFSKLFEPVLGLYSLPGYREIDVAPFVAPFFTIFFGLCLGDAGYGLIVALGALAGMIMGGSKMRPIMVLGFILGFSTLVCGVLMNGFFGYPIFSAPGSDPGLIMLESAEQMKMVSPLGSFKSEGSTVFPAMSLALLVGFIQVFLGMLIQSYVQMRERGFFAGLQPLSSICMAFGAVVVGAHTNFLDLGIPNFTVGPLAVGQMLLMVPQEAGKWIAVGGVAMLLFFNSLDKFFLMRPLTGLWALYNFITGFLSNILSYLRLFALGLAGGLLGGAVNQIAFMLVPNGNYASGWMILAVIILVGGHALNVGLSALGSFVHPLRLTFVEFYGAVGFQGGSKPYVPFAKVEN